MSKEAAGYYQNGKENYKLRMRYELHSDGDIFHHTDLEEALSNTETLYNKWVLYGFEQSKIHEVPYETIPLKMGGRKKKQLRKLPRPTLMIPLLPFDQVEKGAYWITQKIPRPTICKRLYCTLALFARSLLWYNQTEDKKDYESHGDRKKNLAESK